MLTARRMREAALAIGSVVALVALAGCGGSSAHTPGAGNGGPPTPTPPIMSARAKITPVATATLAPPMVGVWQTVDAYAGFSPQVAPSDPTVAYRVEGSSYPYTLERTSDQGAHWAALPAPTWPNGAVATGIAGAFVSPLDAQVVYAIVDEPGATTCGASGVVMHGYCELEYVSRDGGVSWRLLNLPTRGIITRLLKGDGDPRNQTAGDIVAQGTRLYGDVVNDALGQEHAPPPGRLVVSNDGGLTWSLTDGGLHAAGQGIYDFAPTASGSTVFAATVPLSYAPTGPISTPPIQTLWRSDDAGASWVRLGPSPDLVLSMRAAVIERTGTPVLYVLTADDTGRQYIQGSVNGANGAFTAAPLSPTESPTAPANATLLATLSDGSLVIGYGADVESWAPFIAGGSWRSEGASDGLAWVSQAFLRPQASGAPVLWLVGMSASSQVTEYTALKGS